MSQVYLLANGGGGSITIPVTVPQGGTGQQTLPAHAVLVGEGTSAIGSVGPGDTNSILMGQGAGSDPIFGTLVAGSNITLVNGAGTITISSSGGGGAGSIVFTNDSASSATTNAGAINLFGDSASGSSVLGDGAQTITISNVSATSSQLGVVELATNAETISGSSTTLVVTPDDLKAKLGTQTSNGIPYGQGQTSALAWTAQGGANTVLLGNEGVPSFGAVPNAALSNSSVTLNSGNNITVTGGGPLALGGVASFDVTGTTNHAVLVGNASGSINSLSLGTNGQVLLGSTGADPQFGTLTSSDGSITFTTGAGTLGLRVTGGSTTILTITGDSGGALSPTAGNFNILGTAAQGISTSGAGSTLTLTNANASTVQKGVVALATNAETLTGTDTAKALTPDDLTVKLGTQTNHGVMLGQGTTSALGVTAAGSTNQVLIGQTGADPIWGTVPNAALSNSSITLSNGSNITVTGSPVSLGGSATIAVTGTTNHAIQVGNSGGSLTSLTAATNGQIPIGSTGSDPVVANITAGSGISITNGAGSITIASTAGSSLLVASARSISTTATSTSQVCSATTTPTTSNTDSLISITHTPSDSANILEFNFSCPFYQGASRGAGFFLFEGTTLKASYPYSLDVENQQYNTANFTFYQTAGTTLSTTWTVRYASQTVASTVRILENSSGTAIYGGAGNTSRVFTLKEYTA